MWRDEGEVGFSSLKDSSLGPGVAQGLGGWVAPDAWPGTWCGWPPPLCPHPGRLGGGSIQRPHSGARARFPGPGEVGLQPAASEMFPQLFPCLQIALATGSPAPACPRPVGAALLGHV